MKTIPPIPVQFLHWLQANYLHDPSPLRFGEIGCCVLVPIEQATKMILSLSVPPLDLLETCRNHGLIEDFCVASSIVVDPSIMPPLEESVLGHNLGMNRFVGIKSSVLNYNPDSTKTATTKDDDKADFDSLRAEVAALHIPGNSQKPKGETVAKMKADQELLQRIRNHGKQTDDTSLANFLHSCLQPVIKKQT